MMKKLVKLLPLILGLVIAFLVIQPKEIKAYSEQFKYVVDKTLTGGKWAKGKGTVYTYNQDKDVYTTTYHLLKIDLKGDGLLEFNVQTNDNSDSVILLPEELDTTSYLGNNSYLDSWYYGSNTSFSVSRVVKKGAYHIYMPEGYKIKYKFTKFTDKENYCKAKASQLGKNKTATVIMPEDYIYDRWYKITLKAKQEITITYENKFGSGNFTIYDSKMNYKPCPWLEENLYATGELKPGTYYIRVSGYTSYYGDYASGSAMTFKWS
jgi:hypothetical protein